MRKIISITNQKGGSGKTSTSVLITIALAAKGERKVLCIDTDPQAGFTDHFTGTTEAINGLFEALTSNGEVNIVKTKRDNFNIDILAADYRLDSLNVDPYAIQRVIKRIKGYSAIVIDTPPTIQGFSRASAMVADKIIIPVIIGKGVKSPTQYTIDSIQEIKKFPSILFIGYKEPKKDHRGYKSDLSRDFIKTFKKYYAGKIQKTATVEKVISDNMQKWTPKRIDSILNPILKAIGE